MLDNARVGNDGALDRARFQGGSVPDRAVLTFDPLYFLDMRETGVLGTQPLCLSDRDERGARYLATFDIRVTDQAIGKGATFDMATLAFRLHGYTVQTRSLDAGRRREALEMTRPDCRAIQHGV